MMYVCIYNLNGGHHSHVLFTCEHQLEVNYPPRGVLVLVTQQVFTVRTYVCMYTCTHVCISVFTVCMYVCIYVCIYLFLYVYPYVCMCVCITYVYVYHCIYMYLSVCVLPWPRRRRDVCIQCAGS